MNANCPAEGWCHPESAAVRIETFGSLRVAIDRQIVDEQDWRGVRTKMLLKAIIVHGGTQVPVGWLIRTVWPESDAGKGIGKLKVTLLRLRRIGSPENGIPQSWIEYKNNLIALVKPVCWVDSIRFTLTLNNALNNGNADHLVSALNLYAADFLVNDFDVDWVSHHRKQLQDLYIKGVIRLWDLLSGSGDTEPAIFYLQRALDMDPLNEDLYARLMRGCMDSGLPSKAMLIFEQAKEILKKRLSVNPGIKMLSLAKEASRLK